MANIELWRGQSKNLTISNLQTDTLKNGHISKYVFDSDNSGNTELSGCGQLENAKTTITTITSVNQSKQYNISAYLLYSHKFPGSETTYATSNKDVTTLTVKEPLDGTSLTGLKINDENWVWSNTELKQFSITPSFATKNPFSKNGEYVTNATVQTEPIGYVTTIPSGAADITTIKLQWNKSTGNSTDLGSGEQTINVNVKSTEESASTATIISAYSATLTVRNAVTYLNGLSNAEIYARATTQISQTVTFTPTNPYSKALELVGEDNQQISGNSINIDGAVLQLSNDNQTVTLDASAATNTEDKTFKFRIRSIQGAHNVDTDLITFTVKAVADITVQPIVEGQNTTVDAGIGDIASVSDLVGPIKVEFTGASVSITGTAVDVDTDWSVKVTNATGAHITISGTTTHLDDVSVNINTGDYIIIGTDILKGLTTNFEIVSGPTAGTASITNDGKLKYEASTADGPIVVEAANTYPIKVKGANGATQTVNVVVSNINTTPSSADYLCFTSTGNSTVAMRQTGTPNTSANKVLQYKLNNGEWQTWDLSRVSLSDGDKMYLKSDDEIPMSEPSDMSESTDIYKQFVMTGHIAASGNIMSLLNFSTTLTAYAFYKLFDQCSSLTTAPELLATALADYCYKYIFSGCYLLTTAPELPATTLAKGCYTGMFNSCNALTTAPELPATTLADYCYSEMFSSCKSLTTAPALPATTLAKSCYQQMFNQCKSLTTAPDLPATTLAPYCYSNMFAGHWSYGWVPLTQAPELPATTLAEGCYNNMFKYCQNLNYVKAMFTDISARSCLNFWLKDVSTTGTFVKNASATWTNEAAEIPTGWTVETA